MKKLHEKRVGRPKKRRFIEADPKINQFSPRGRPGRPDEAVLAIDEYEAIRLAYYKDLSQSEAARSMNISQQTFSRTLQRANKAIADALVNGKTIYIQEGSVNVVSRVQQAGNSKPAFDKLINDAREYLSENE